MTALCSFTFCDQPQGFGTWMQITLPNNLLSSDTADYVLPVCEQHWQAIRLVST